MTKERILRTAANLFANYGIKGVSMSQIAGALCISKKTLYEQFENKEDLLSECLDYERKRMNKIMENTEHESGNPVEAFILGLTDLYQYKSNFCPSFLKDIKRFPQLHHKFIINKERLRGKYIGYLNRGVQQGYFMPEYDYERISEIIVEQFIEGRSSIQQPHFMMTFLRGICTEKGLETLNNFTPQNIKGIINEVIIN